MNNNGKRLLELIERSGLSYGALSERTGIPKSALQRYATGDTIKIPAERAELLARELGSTAAYILGITENTLHLFGYHVERIAHGKTRLIDVLEPENYIDLDDKEYEEILLNDDIEGAMRKMVEAHKKAKPTPASEDGLSEEKRKLIEAVKAMSDDDVRRLRVIVDQVILLRGE